MQKCGEQRGFVTPVVHTLTYENQIFKYYFILGIFNIRVNSLPSKYVAKPKVKGIDGEFSQLWIIWVIRYNALNLTSVGVFVFFNFLIINTDL